MAGRAMFADGQVLPGIAIRASVTNWQRFDEWDFSDEPGEHRSAIKRSGEDFDKAHL